MRLQSKMSKPLGGGDFSARPELGDAGQHIPAECSGGGGGVGVEGVGEGGGGDPEGLAQLL